MPPSPKLWTEVTASEHDHERAALHFVHERFPEREPFRAWTNFMFIGEDGTRNEVDMLVVSPTGVYLVEIKSYPGRIDGDAGTWTWTSPEGRRRTFDNPLLLAERKAKKLKSLLIHQQAFRSPRMRDKGFYLKSIVFLSDSDLTIGLNEAGRTDVYGPDTDELESDQENDLPGLVQLFAKIDPKYGRQVDRPLSKAIAEAMDQAGIRESTTHRKIGSYELEGLLDEGEGWQDFAARHTQVSSRCGRVRLYLTGRAQTEDERGALARAAEREFRFLEGIEHPGIERPIDLLQTTRGPALIFERDPEGERLDHWLADHREELSLYDRIELVRQLAETIRHAHRQNLYHRALAPQHITVVTRDGKPLLKVRDWQMGARKLSTSTSGASGTEHIVDHVSEPAQVYLAPETLTLPDPQPVPADIWSLGAIAFLILSGQPPAPDRDGLHELLRERDHLTLVAAMDAPDSVLDQIIKDATAVDATSRYVSVDEFLEFLDFALAELTAPEEEDPLNAGKDDVVGDAWTVVRRIGTGSTSVVLLAETPDREEVLKVARTDEHAKRVRIEFEILQGLRDRTIIEPYGLEQIGGRTVLRLEAAQGTLSDELKKHGALSLDILERFGSDLLDAVILLDEEGVAHRDIKPDNLGIAERGKDRQRHLVLFDFSLARTDPSEINVGTVGYLDPFLAERKTKRWDQQAERYAAAVTLYEMATGSRPRWGDGSTDPLLTNDLHPVIDNELFDQAVRDRLTAFFEKALHRDPAHRFHTAGQMRRAWESVFSGIDRVPTGIEEAASVADIDLEEVTRETTLAELPLAPRVRNALERLGLLRLGDLADVPPAELVRLSGIGAMTRREIKHLAHRLRGRFAGATARSSRGIASLDKLAEQLVPDPPADEDSRKIVAEFLGLSEDSPWLWPTHREVTDSTGLKRDAIADTVASARERWRRNPDLTKVRNDLVARLSQRGGIAGGDELGTLLLSERGSLAEGSVRSARARAVVRAAVEAEAILQQPRLIARRLGDAFLVAVDGSIALDEEEETWRSERLFEFAAALGEQAEEIAARDILLSPQAVIETLRTVDPPEGVEPLEDARLVRVAAAASNRVAVSSRLELYPVGMPPERAIEESRGALLDRRGLKVENVRERIRARFPDAAAIPGRPALDALLSEIGLRWDPTNGHYVVPQRSGVLSTYTSSGRKSTSFATPDERATAVREFDQRLAAFVDLGGFLALTVDRRWMQSAAEHIAARLHAETIDMDRLLLGEMRRIVSSAEGARWDRFLKADNEKGERGWSVLQQVVDRAIQSVRAHLYKSDGLILLKNFGLLARYERFGLLEGLRDELTHGKARSSLTGVVLLTLGEDPTARPVVDGQAVPVITANQWAHVPSAWLQAQAEEEVA